MSNIFKICIGIALTKCISLIGAVSISYITISGLDVSNEVISISRRYRTSLVPIIKPVNNSWRLQQSLWLLQFIRCPTRVTRQSMAATTKSSSSSCVTAEDRQDQVTDRWASLGAVAAAVSRPTRQIVEVEEKRNECPDPPSSKSIMSWRKKHHQVSHWRRREDLKEKYKNWKEEKRRHFFGFDIFCQKHEQNKLGCQVGTE